MAVAAAAVAAAAAAGVVAGAGVGWVQQDEARSRGKWASGGPGEAGHAGRRGGRGAACAAAVGHLGAVVGGRELCSSRYCSCGDGSVAKRECSQAGGEGRAAGGVGCTEGKPRQASRARRWARSLGSYKGDSVAKRPCTNTVWLM